MLNAARLAASLGVSGQTIARHLDLLCDPMLVRRLQPWAKQSSKRLVKAPKVFVRDSGQVHALLGLGDATTLLSHPVVGGSLTCQASHAGQRCSSACSVAIWASASRCRRALSASAE